MCEDTTSVDVGNQDYGAINALGKSHVGDVIVPQIDFGRATRTLYNNVIILATQLL